MILSDHQEGGKQELEVVLLQVRVNDISEGSAEGAMEPRELLRLLHIVSERVKLVWPLAY